MTNPGIVISSKWICPVTRPPILRGALAIRDKRIEAIGAADAILSEFKSYEHRDYGDALVVPGLINLHSHLDYAALAQLETNASLFEWIPLLMKSVAKWAPADFFRSGLWGAQLNALAGTTCIVDSSYSGQSAEAIAAAGLRGVVGLELFGVDQNNHEIFWKNWLSRFEKLAQDASSTLKNAIAESRVTLTCSPHAPYTVCPPLWMKAKEWAEGNQRPLLAHLAESEAECAWIKGEESIIDSYLMKVMPPNAERDTKAILNSIDWKRPGLSPTRFLQEHRLLSNRLVAAHAIHVDQADMEVLKDAGVSIAHCPRSNSRLRNGRAPLPDYLKAGVNAGLGTDGLPSTDSLDLIAEANFAINLHRAVQPDNDISSDDVLRMLTINAARAIGMEDMIGSLDVGKQADIAVFNSCFGDKDFHAKASTHTSPSNPAPPSQSLEAPPADLLIRFPTTVEAVYVDGQPVVEAGRLRKIGTYAC